MGTSYSIKYLPAEDSTASTALEVARLVADELEKVNKQMSTYDPNSELSKFNASRSTDWFAVSPDTAQTVAVALDVSKMTDGAFDVTVGPLVNLWGFGPDGRADEAPSDGMLARTRQSCGYDKLAVRTEPPALKKLVPTLQIDLSAIAKGHGVDRLAELFESLNMQNYFIEVGGEIRASGRRVDGTAWRAGIELPVEDATQRTLHSSLPLSGKSLATSGNYRNFYSLSKQRISHTIDPRTGRPAETFVASASVVAADCRYADAVATSLMVLGQDAGLAFAEEHQIAALLLVVTGAELQTVLSTEMEQLDLAAMAQESPWVVGRMENVAE